MEKSFDITVSRGDRLCRRDEHGLYQSSEYGYTLTEKDVPENLVTERSLELRLKIVRFLNNSEVLDQKKSPEEALQEIQVIEDNFKKWREKNGRNNGA